jgi:SHS2 domain-containing protein
MGRFEIVEHTADVGLRAYGETLADVLEQATLALAEIEGIWRPGAGEEVRIELEAGDPGALVVDWLSEIIYLQDSRGAALADVRVEDATETSVRGVVGLVPLDDVGGEDEGVQVKAITYHQLEVGRDDGGWRAQVFVDV